MNNSVSVTTGMQGHSRQEREINDFYATDPIAINLLLEQETFNKNILEPACGMGHLSKRLSEKGYNVTSYDLINRGFGQQKDFFTVDSFDGDIITNPPFKDAVPFIQHSLDIIPNGHKVAMFLKLLFLESRSRKQFFQDNPPKTIYVASGRINCARDGEFEKYPSSAVCFCWFMWEKGYHGDTVLKWIN